MAVEGLRDLPVGRHLAIDERGVGLRATWRLDRGFVNLSFWREDTCVETFHLDPNAAASLIAFLVQGLAEVTTTAASASPRPLTVVPPRPSLERRVQDGVLAIRSTIAQRLTELGDAIRPR